MPEGLEKFIAPIITMCNAQFPRRCGKCGRVFSTFKELVGAAKPLGALQCFSRKCDISTMLSYLNCQCGSTMTLVCTDRTAHAQFVDLLQKAAREHGISESGLLLLVRAEVRRRVLSS